METKPLSKYFAELIGTFVLVFIGTGSAVLASGANATHSGTAIGFTGIAFAFGISVLVMVYAIGPISGCHINPAITIAMLVAGKISGKDSVGYIIAQLIGGFAGSAVLLVIAHGMPGYDIAVNGLGQNGYGIHSPGGFNMEATLVSEVVMTFIFIFVVFGATAKNAAPGFAGLAIGLTLTAVHLVGLTVTGLSVNPARSIAPALFVGGDAVSQLWLFIVGPIAGGILAAVVWKMFKRD
jgi:aquaporin Z